MFLKKLTHPLLMLQAKKSARIIGSLLMLSFSSCSYHQQNVTSFMKENSSCHKQEVLEALNVKSENYKRVKELPGGYCTTPFVADQLYFIAGSVYSNYIEVFKQTDRWGLELRRNNHLSEEYTAWRGFYVGKTDQSPILKACFDADANKDNVITAKELSKLEDALYEKEEE